jgi:hypothetical protein
VNLDDLGLARLDSDVREYRHQAFAERVQLLP